MNCLTLLLLSCCLASAALAERKRYDGHQLWRIHPRGEAQIEFVYSKQSDEELDFWHEEWEMVDILIPPHKAEALRAELNARDIFFTVQNTNIQRDIDVEVEQLALRVTDPKRPVNYNDWNRLADILEELDNLAARCPASVSCETFVVGRSLQGREIKGLRIYRGSNRPAVWIDATTHAREWLSTATHLRIMKHLIDDFSDPTVADLLNKYDWWLIPVVNPDGYEFSWTSDRMWRKNRSTNTGSTCIGTDLNRNFDQQWGNAGASTNACSETYRGASAASEPETRAIQDALRARASNLIYTMHFHTYGQLWLIPWGSTTGGACNIAADHADMMVVANAAANAVQSTYNTSWARGNSCATIYPASGITPDYAKGVAGIKYTVTPELRGNNFIVSTNEITPSFNEMWNGVVTSIRTIEQQEKLY